MIVTCTNCGKRFDKPSYYVKRGMKNHFCNQKCRSEFVRGKNHPRYNTYEIKCANCNKVYLIKKSQIDRCNINCCSKECMYKYRIKNGHLVEENNPNWKGGVMKLNHQLRGIGLYKEWRDACFIRDDYTCQRCGKVGGDLHVHHIIGFNKLLLDYGITNSKESRYCEQLWDITNGITLCPECHKREHK